MKKAAIILAGGIGKRFGSEIPKQFAELNKKTVIEYSIEKFCDVVDEMVVVSHIDYVEEIKNRYNVKVVEGGRTRQLSVKNGLDNLSGRNIDYVAIHDSARPLVSKEMVVKLFDIVIEKKAVIPVINSSSSLCRVKDGVVSGYLCREEIFFIQTPQVFEYNLIYEAHKEAYLKNIFDFTDDSQLIDFIGKKVSVITGEETNIKITTKFDLEIAENLIQKGLV
ncbi:MAG: 2-C-methyl-D-erythritol 4-phosphate cytidylyltransferase [Brevinematales bacterium]|nr:2-C-methyl-D-erythritol 4-phosphate cytidylyltransferase [Brevinematales bacterium]